jgi:hypothetical protein
MTALTIFTWGYAGWGSSTLELKKAMDAVEQARAYAPPYFVDLRMARRGRALGFRENSFEQTVGKNRYQWMPSLGNRRIVTRSGPRIQINEPAAVEELLGIGLRRIVQRQRLIIFCSCGLPGLPGRKGSCHRVEVASLLLNTAVKRKVSLTMVEWPGGQPTLRTVRIADRAAQAIRRGTRHAPLGTRQPAPDLLALISHAEPSRTRLCTVVANGCCLSRSAWPINAVISGLLRRKRAGSVVCRDWKSEKQPTASFAPENVDFRFEASAQGHVVGADREPAFRLLKEIQTAADLHGPVISRPQDLAAKTSPIPDPAEGP